MGWFGSTKPQRAIEEAGRRGRPKGATSKMTRAERARGRVEVAKAKAELARIEEERVFLEELRRNDPMAYRRLMERRLGIGQAEEKANPLAETLNTLAQLRKAGLFPDLRRGGSEDSGPLGWIGKLLDSEKGQEAIGTLIGGLVGGVREAEPAPAAFVPPPIAAAPPPAAAPWPTAPVSPPAPPVVDAAAAPASGAVSAAAGQPAAQAAAAAAPSMEVRIGLQILSTKAPAEAAVMMLEQAKTQPTARDWVVVFCRTPDAELPAVLDVWAGQDVNMATVAGFFKSRPDWTRAVVGELRGLTGYAPPAPAAAPNGVAAVPSTGA